MKQVEKITVEELRGMAEKTYGEIVKANVDIAQRIIVVDAELHVDIEQFMLDNGSRQEDLWGLNLYPDQFGSEDFIEFDSMTNIRPQQGNRSRYVEDAVVREEIIKIVSEVVTDDRQ